MVCPENLRGLQSDDCALRALVETFTLKKVKRAYIFQTQGMFVVVVVVCSYLEL